MFTTNLGNTFVKHKGKHETMFSQMHSLFICRSGITTQKHVKPLYVIDGSSFHELQIARHIY